MTISVPNQLVYSSNGDGATSQFSYPVRILEAGELVVIRSEGGVDTPLTLNADYTLSGIGDAGGVTITMLSVPTAGQEITRYRATAPKQIVDLKDKQTNPAEAVEQQLDRLAMVGQDHNQRISEYEGRIDDLDISVAAAAASATAAGTSETNAAASATAAGADADRAEAAAASIDYLTVADRTALKAADTTAHTVVYFDGSNWEQVAYADVSTLVAVDTVEGIYARSTQDAAKVWVRLFDGPVPIVAFGAVGDNATDNLTAISVAVAVAALVKKGISVPVDADGGTYAVISGELTIPANMSVHYEAGASIVASGSGSIVDNGRSFRFGGSGLGTDGVGRNTKGMLITLEGPSTTGGTGAGEAAWNFISIPSDTLDMGSTQPKKVDGFGVLHKFGGAGTRGGRHAAQFRLFLTEPTEADNPDDNYCGVVGQVAAQSGDNGTDTGSGAKGSFFAGNMWASADAGATNLLGVVGIEFNQIIYAGASAKRRVSVQVAGGGAVQATDLDAAVSVSNLGGTSVPWKNGVSFNNKNGYWALNSASTVLSATSANAAAASNTVQHGIDLDGITCAGSLLRAKGVNLINGANPGLTLGHEGASSTPNIRFRSGAVAAPVCDSQIIASSGTGSDLNGTLTLSAATIAVTGGFRPNLDNALPLGNASVRWSVVYAGTGTINTSDERQKTPFRPFTEAERAALIACRDKIGLYQFLDAVVEKGDAARLHAGIPAQTCTAEFERRGLDPWRYAWFCRDKRKEFVKRKIIKQRQASHEETHEETTVEVANGRAVLRAVHVPVEVPHFDLIPVVDEDGSPVMRSVEYVEGDKRVRREEPMLHQVPVMEDVEIEVEEEVETDDYVYAIRYAELAMAILSVLQPA